jgi:hypothetical protein
MTKKELEEARRNDKAQIAELEKKVKLQQLQIEYYKSKDKVNTLPIPQDRPVGKLKVINQVTIFGEVHTFGSLQIDKERDGWWYQGYWELFSLLRDWCGLSISRKPNISEFYSESTHAWGSNSLRRLSKKESKTLDPTITFTAKGKKEADNFNLVENQTVEVKCSTLPSDCSQLSPSDRKVNIIAYLDFFNDGDVDGSCSIYNIPYELCKPVIANKEKNETVEDQLNQGRRAKISLVDDIIKPNNITPTQTNVRLW